MDIESDFHDCECGRGKGRLRLFQGWSESSWSNHSTYSPTFLDLDTYHSMPWKILLGVLWFVLFEYGVSWLAFAAPQPLWTKWLVFSFFTVYAGLFAFFFAHLTMNVVDVLCHALIGRTRYAFLDTMGDLHIHRENPVTVYASPGSFSDYKNWDTYLLYYRIFQVRIGGIFRKCKVIAGYGTSWKLSVGLFDDRIHIIDEVGSRFVICRELESGPGHLVTERERLKQALRFVVQYKRLSPVLTTLDKSTELDQAFDTLGTECAELVHLMETSKQTMGRSKHAQLLRERLEAIFRKMPAHRVKAWEDRAAKAEVKPEPTAKAS